MISSKHANTFRVFEKSMRTGNVSICQCTSTDRKEFNVKTVRFKGIDIKDKTEIFTTFAEARVAAGDAISIIMDDDDFYGVYDGAIVFD